MAARGNRREFLKGGAAGLSVVFPAPAWAQNATPRVVVVGGGFGGASCARALTAAKPRLAVTLVEQNRTYTACPLGNSVIAGVRDLTAQQFTYDKLAAEGITVAIAAATEVDPKARTVLLGDGTRIGYDRLVLSPGIDLRWNSPKGYTEAVARDVPHAWASGEQIALLSRQLAAMDDGGMVAISVPVSPARCPPGPYERASMIAHYLKTRKPRSKLVVLDAKDTFSMQRLFQNAWKELYPDLIEWIALSQGGNITEFDPATKTLIADFEKYKADVVNIIPPQKAGRIAALAGVADRTGWCPVDLVTFESTLQPNIHVIGDAVIAGALPKAASAASAEAKLCADAIAKLLGGGTPSAPTLKSTCYSLVAPDYAISITGEYRPTGGQYLEVEGAGKTSPLEAPRSERAREAKSADAWFKAITHGSFG